MKTPLVSIVVLTYNSEKYIIEALDSIKSQDYGKIELIVSDDGSKDKTCELVESWFKKNDNIFFRTNIIKTYINKGTCCNYNQGVYNSCGEYIKTLDGDDTLGCPTAISDYIQFMENHNYEICISDVKVISNNNIDLSSYKKQYDEYFACVNETLPEQKRRIIHELSLPNPGVFFTRKIFDIVGGFDEKYKLLEEWPFFMKVLDSNYQIGALKKKLVCYRINPSSVTHRQTKKSYVQKICAKDNLKFLLNKRLNRLLKEKEYIFALGQLRMYVNNYLKQLV